MPREFLGAFKFAHRKEVREYIDDDFSYDLLKRLKRNPGDTEAREALRWMAKYNDEFYRGFLKKGDPNALHRTPELYKHVNDSRNAQRRDLIGAAHAGKSINKDGEPYLPITLVELDQVS